MDIPNRALAAALADLQAPLSSLPGKPLLTAPAAGPLRQALVAMQQRRVGSVLAVDDAGLPLGILTRHDLLGRIVLAQCPLDVPLSRVMSAPLHTLTLQHTLHDAAMLMARQGLRHVPVVDERGRLANLVSEHDLVALQRHSLAGLSERLSSASSEAELADGARAIRALAGRLLGQGLGARALAQLISHLNDRLTARLVERAAPAHGVDLQRVCWVAFGSEGRGEQTIATDQDNGLVFEAADGAEADALRPGLMAFGQAVNEALDRLGYPLCRGLVMAGQARCCLSTQEWAARFGQWMRQGSPQDLLDASIYFDWRALAGAPRLLAPLHDAVRAQPAPPRFLHLLAANALRQAPPLNWRGAIATTESEGRETLDLKLQGTALFVDAARILALAAGCPEVGTHERLLAAGAALKVPAAECGAWAAAFQRLQGLRLRVQLGHGLTPASPGQPNRIAPQELNDLDREGLKDALQVARRLQQRVAMDFRVS